MKRKITRNNHQYKISLPIELVRKLALENAENVKLQEVDTPMGKGLLILKDDEEVMRLDVR